MQSVSAAFTAEERDSVRSIAHNLQVSWKKESTLGNRTFTIGVSSIGGNDIIGINPGAIGSPGNYRYFDETAYALNLEWERSLNMPIGGLSKALAEATLDNTSGRFTPRFMGATRSSTELFTANYQPRKPFIISAGFEFGGVDQLLPQFAGIFTKPPKVDVRSKTVDIQGADYVDFFQNRFLDQEIMATAERTDEVLETLFRDSLGMSTAQYELDTGINIIPFLLFPKGTRFSDIVHQLVEAENGHLYQDEEGIFRFENRQHWDSSPYSDVQRIVLTGQVLEAESPTDDHLINVVEFDNIPIREKQPAQTIFNLPVLTSIEVPANSSVSKFFEFQDPVLALTDPTSGGTNSYFVGNSESDETGTDMTSSLTFTNRGTFAQSVKYQITNSSSSIVYVTQLVLSGRIAKETSRLYYRDSDSSSVTAYEERPLKISNPYIQNESWARSLASMILRDFSEPENLQRIKVRAIPELQLGDLISWQGRYWRVHDIKTKLDPSVGFIQELTMLQRTISSYFRIGISTIGSSDLIAP